MREGERERKREGEGERGERREREGHVQTVTSVVELPRLRGVSHLDGPCNANPPRALVPATTTTTITTTTTSTAYCAAIAQPYLDVIACST